MLINIIKKSDEQNPGKKYKKEIVRNCVITYIATFFFMSILLISIAEFNLTNIAISILISSLISIIFFIPIAIFVNAFYLRYKLKK